MFSRVETGASWQGNSRELSLEPLRYFLGLESRFCWWYQLYFFPRNQNFLTAIEIISRAIIAWVTLLLTRFRLVGPLWFK